MKSTEIIIIIIRVICSIGFILLGIFAHCWLPIYYKWPLIIAGIAVLLHFLVDIAIVLAARYSLWEVDKSTPIAKTDYDSTRFTINILVVTSGVLMGLIKDSNNPAMPVAMISLGLGILLGIINITIVTGGTVEDYTETKHKKTINMIALINLHSNISQVLFNLQFIALFVGIAAIGWQ